MRYCQKGLSVAPGRQNILEANELYENDYEENGCQKMGRIIHF